MIQFFYFELQSDTQILFYSKLNKLLFNFIRILRIINKNDKPGRITS